MSGVTDIAGVRGMSEVRRYLRFRLKVTSCCPVSPLAPDIPLWSKLQSGSVPNLQQIFQILDQQLKINQVDPSSFST